MSVFQTGKLSGMHISFDKIQCLLRIQCGSWYFFLIASSLVVKRWGLGRLQLARECGQRSSGLCIQIALGSSAPLGKHSNHSASGYWYKSSAVHPNELLLCDPHGCIWAFRSIGRNFQALLAEHFADGLRLHSSLVSHTPSISVLYHILTF